MHRRLVAALIALLTVLVTAVISVPPSTATTSSKTRAPLQYVALGDSYSAASGVLPLAPGSPPACLRSARNYPRVIATRLGAALRDVTCGAADTGDYRAAQFPGVAPQLRALSRRTDLVTMTIGGNDSGVFVNSIVRCGALAATTLGLGNPCQRRFGSSFEDTLRTKTFPSLVRALRDVRAKAPRARVAILGYPWIVPQQRGCYPILPIARGDVPYLRSLQTTLNNVVRRAANRTGATYVNLNRVSHGHDACKPIGTRWVEPVVTTTNPVIVHPNALGERRMAQRAMTVLGLG